MDTARLRGARPSLCKLPRHGQLPPPHGKWHLHAEPHQRPPLGNFPGFPRDSLPSHCLPTHSRATPRHSACSDHGPGLPSSRTLRKSIGRARWPDLPGGWKAAASHRLQRHHPGPCRCFSGTASCLLLPVQDHVAPHPSPAPLPGLHPVITGRGKCHKAIKPCHPLPTTPVPLRPLLSGCSLKTITRLLPQGLCACPALCLGLPSPHTDTRSLWLPCLST